MHRKKDLKMKASELEVTADLPYIVLLKALLLNQELLNLLSREEQESYLMMIMANLQQAKSKEDQAIDQVQLAWQTIEVKV
jgi:hypothetical protein